MRKMIREIGSVDCAQRAAKAAPTWASYLAVMEAVLTAYAGPTH